MKETINSIRKLVEMYTELTKYITIKDNLEKQINKEKNLTNPKVSNNLLDYAYELCWNSLFQSYKDYFNEIPKSRIDSAKEYLLGKDPNLGYEIEKTDDLEKEIEELRDKIKVIRESKYAFPELGAKNLLKSKETIEKEKANLINDLNITLGRKQSKLDEINTSNANKIATHDNNVRIFEETKNKHQNMLIKDKIQTTEANLRLEILIPELNRYNNLINITLENIANLESELTINNRMIYSKYKRLSPMTCILEFLESGRAKDLGEAYNIFELNPNWNDYSILNESKLKDLRCNEYWLLTNNLNRANDDCNKILADITDRVEDNIRTNASLADLEVIQCWKEESYVVKLSPEGIELYKNDLWIK